MSVRKNYKIRLIAEGSLWIIFPFFPLFLLFSVSQKFFSSVISRRKSGETFNVVAPCAAADFALLRKIRSPLPSAGLLHGKSAENPPHE